MKKKLKSKELLVLSSMLFGMFFGAGNLIFPASMGQLAGKNVWIASVGFLVTGVGLPLLGVAALGISRENGLLELAGRVGKPYGFFFTCVLYLTIGPFFAIPRCATVSYSVGIERLFPDGTPKGALLIFSVVFFAAVLFFSLRPGEILMWVGKVLNPLFLIFLGILLIRALLSPMGEIGLAEASGTYATGAFFTGFLEGYNTMDALAGLAFGIVVVNAIKDLGVRQSDEVAKSTVKAGMLSSLMMAVIYVLVAVVGAQSRGVFEASRNGGEALALIAEYYFGRAGAFILAVTISVACLKTAVGLITSCSETFEKMMPCRISYRVWAILFCVLSFGIANLGLNAIIAYSVPVLRFLYPLSIVLILLTLLSGILGDDRKSYKWVIGFTAAASALDFVNALPVSFFTELVLIRILKEAAALLPFSEIGFGWVIPAVLGWGIGKAVKRV